MRTLIGGIYFSDELQAEVFELQEALCLSKETVCSQLAEVSKSFNIIQMLNFQI
jgi:hypothetical protein